MKNINYILGNENIETRPIGVYSDVVCEFLNELSATILKSPYARQYPDLSAVAFWCRKANIQKKKEVFGITDNKLGRGLCFHIAPSNIPINFAFSYFFGLLAGNANIVRVPSKDFPQVNILINIIKVVLEKFSGIKSRTAFIKYDRNNEITEEFSKLADARMIWGGDKTISLMRKLDTKPRCIDITFADRYSVCMIDAESINKATDEEIKKLASNFYNDTYLMDQNACSSPQLIYWLNDNSKAREKFWSEVYDYANGRYELQDAVAVDKYTKFCENAIEFGNIGKITMKTNLLYRSEIKTLENIENIRGKGGYFCEYSLNDLEEFYNVVNEKYQTITYFGIDTKTLSDGIVSHNLKGIDRIVPIGKAMDIDIIWDGHNLVEELSRCISII